MSDAKQVPTLDKRPPPSTVEDEEELDDILDEFSSTPSQTQPPLESPLEPTFSGRPRTNTRVDEPPKSIPGTTKTGPILGSTLEEGESPDEDALTQAFAAELQKEMESLMRELGDQAGGVDGSAAEDTEGLSEEERQRQSLQAVWEKLLIDGLNDPGSLVGEPMEGTTKGAGAAGPSGSTGSAFQDKIKEAMNKIAEGEGKVKSEGPAPSPESLEELLKSLGDLGLGGNGADPDETELASFLDNMMGQLMSKEVLYEPLKELSEGFPKYLANPPKPLSSDDKGKYEKQYELTKKILAVFDAPDYSDGDSKRAEQIVELMSEMQALGTPPKEIMGELPAGLDFGGEGCVVA